MKKHIREKRHLLQKDYLLAIIAGGIFITINFALFTVGPLYMIHSGYSEFMAGLQNTLFAFLLERR